MAHKPRRCECCGQILPIPPELCTCGHPMNSHHRTDTGNMTFCTLWVLTTTLHTNGSMTPCPCKKGTPQ